MADIGAEAGIVGSGVYRHFDSKTAILVAMADRVMDRLMTRSAAIIAAGLDEGQTLSLLVRDHIEVALTDRDALAVYHREVRTLPEDERRRLSRAQRHYIEEWVHLLAPLRPDLTGGEVRLAVHAAIGAIQSTLFFRSGLADERLTELLDGMAHGCLGTDPAVLGELPQGWVSQWRRSAAVSSVARSSGKNRRPPSISTTSVAPAMASRSQ